MADEMRAYDPTMRERMASALQGGMEGMGVGRQKARRHAQTIVGGESSNLPIGMGIADFVPFVGTTMALEEGARGLGSAAESAKRGDYIDATAETAGAAAGLIPGGYSTYKTGKNMLKKLKTLDLPKLKPIETESVPKKKQQSLKEWAMAGGGVPTSHAGRTDVWHKKAQKYAEGGAVYAKGGAIKNAVKGAIKGVTEGVQKILPSAEREENLQKFLGNSRIRERLYHATPKDFKAFKPGGDDPTMSGPAIWLTPNAKKQPAAHNISSRSQEFREGVNVMPVYAQARSPLMLDDKLSIEWARDVFANGSREFPDLISPQTVQELKKEGYDSIIHADPYGNRGGEQEIIMFEPNKIKSAIGNRGTYDIEDADINKNKGGAIKAGVKGLLKGTQETLPAAQRDANLAKMLEGSAVKERVYHGTNADIRRFSDKKLGKNTDSNASSEGYAQTSRVGHWFSTKPTGDSLEMSKAGYTVDMPAYLSIKNPKREMSLDWLAQGLESKKGRAYRRELEKQGYDGIVLPDEEFGGESWVAFRPEQIKSAIGNRGTYDINEPDITKAKGGAVKKAVKGAVEGVVEGIQKILTPAERDANKAKFLEPSAVKERMYHGTTANINQFKPQTGDAVFLTPDPKFASKFAWNDMLFTASPQDGGFINPGANVMPLHVQVKNPFDYENPKHIRSVLSNLDSRDKKAFKKSASEGSWQEIEKHIGTIQDTGFDSVFLKEMGRKNLAVFEPNQIKSAIGNRGTYDVTRPDLNEAHGGAIHMAKGGKVKDIVKGALTSAAEAAGMKAPVTANKDLTTLQDFHTSLGDRVRQGAAETQNMIESMPFKYDKGQRVFTDDSSKKNKAPYTILQRTRFGNQVVYDTEGGGMKARKDPNTGKAMRTPYEPGYKVRQENGDDFSEFIIPESAIRGDVEMAKGGKVKGVVKSGLKKLLGKADEAPKGVEPIIVRTPEERAVIDKFGQKQEQEAVRQKKVEKAAKESAGKSPEETAKPAKSTGKRVAVPPDFYRKMAEEQGDEAVLNAARAGKHLKPSGKGFIGAPRTVKGKRGLNTMRSDIDQDFKDSVDAVRLADPKRLGTWYDRAKQGIAESSEPYQLPRTLEQHGVYSAGVSPESELTFALKHLNSRVAGDPRMAYRGAGMENLDEAVAEGRPANMGFKIGEYANKNDPRIPNAGLFGVNDFRRAQGMGYTDAAGNPWHEGVRDTMHPFMDAETALQVDRANAAGTGGRTDWGGPQIQEVPWVYGKAQDQYGRGSSKGGRYGGDELEGIKQSIVDANNTARDYMYKHAASATHEQIPGASLGHVRQALDMTPEEKLAYGREGRFDMPSPEAALNEFPEVGAGNRDAIYGALGYRQLPSVEAQGLYMNKLGEVETNPMTIARPLMDFPTGGGGGRMADDSSRVMDTAEQFRALMDAQEAGAYNLPNTMAGVKGKNSMVFDTRDMNPNKLNDPSAGVLPTSEQLAKMGNVMGDYGFGVTATNRGAVAFPFDSSMDPKAASSAFRKTGKQMQEIFPSSQEKAITSTGYVPGVGKRSPEGPLSTAPYSGEATSDMLRAFSELPPTVSQNLGESEAVRAAIRAKALRDSKLGGTRGDIQETRRFFSEADWPKAVAMMRKGMTPAAALAALGYNINAMAADER